MITTPIPISTLTLDQTDGTLAATLSQSFQSVTLNCGSTTSAICNLANKVSGTLKITGAISSGIVSLKNHSGTYDFSIASPSNCGLAFENCNSTLGSINIALGFSSLTMNNCGFTSLLFASTIPNYIYLTGCTLLASVNSGSVSGIYNPSLYWVFNACALNTGQIDGILALAAYFANNSLLTDVYMDLSGGANGAPTINVAGVYPSANILFNSDASGYTAAGGGDWIGIFNQWYIWFQIGSSSDPGVGYSGGGIQVTLGGTETANDIIDLVVAAISSAIGGYVSTSVAYPYLGLTYNAAWIAPGPMAVSSGVFSISSEYDGNEPGNSNINTIKSLVSGATIITN